MENEDFNNAWFLNHCFRYKTLANEVLKNVDDWEQD